MSERQRIEIAPVGEVGDGAVVLGHNPTPAHHRSEFELYYEWDGDPERADTVYIGGKAQAVALAEAITELIDDE